MQYADIHGHIWLNMSLLSVVQAAYKILYTIMAEKLAKHAIQHVLRKKAFVDNKGKDIAK